MTADWVAVAVRGRGLSSRRVGGVRAREIASQPSFGAALAALAATPYGRDVRSGMDLRAAQHAVATTLLWHLRILAGWAPPGGAERIRLLAGRFEIANVVGRLAALDGRPAQAPYDLGTLAAAWPRLETAPSPQEMRTGLAASAWGDPGSEEIAGVRTALECLWARRVFEGVPEGRAWAAGYAALLAARALAGGAPIGEGSTAQRHLSAILGTSWQRADGVAALAASVPVAARWALRGVEGAEDLWHAEARWWSHVESDGFRLTAAAQPNPGIVVGVAALLAADAWCARGALELAARGGRATEWFDAVA